MEKNARVFTTSISQYRLQALKGTVMDDAGNDYIIMGENYFHDLMNGAAITKRLTTFAAANKWAQINRLAMTTQL